MTNRVSKLFPATSEGQREAKDFASVLNEATKHLGHLGAEAIVTTEQNAEDLARGCMQNSRVQHYKVIWTVIKGLTPEHGMSNYAFERSKNGKAD